MTCEHCELRFRQLEELLSSMQSFREDAIDQLDMLQSMIAAVRIIHEARDCDDTHVDVVLSDMLRIAIDRCDDIMTTVSKL